MTTDPVTIDLGVLPQRTGDAAEPAAAEPAGPARRRRFRRWTTWGVAATTALLVVTMGAAAAPGPSWLAAHFSAPTLGWFALTDQHLYVEGPARDGTVSAYRLADGAQRWEATLGVPLQSMHATLEEDGVLVLSGIALEPGEGPGGATIALDTATGEELWGWPGFPTTVLPGPQLLFWRPGDTLAKILHNDAYSYTAVDLAGTELWTISVQDVVAESLGEATVSTRLVTLARDGRLTSYDLTTGTQLATGPGSVGAATPGVWVVGEQVLVRGRWDRPALAAYGAETLTEQWSVDLPAEFWRPFGCGQLVCLTGPGTVTAVDPAAGRPMWSVEVVRDQLFPAYDLGAGWQPGLVVADRWVLDAATGERLLDLRAWQPYGVTSPPGLGATPAPVVTWTEPRSAAETGRTWFGSLRLDPPAVEVLAAVDSQRTGGGCQVAAGHIACHDRGHVHVWRITSDR